MKGGIVPETVPAPAVHFFRESSDERPGQEGADTRGPRPPKPPQGPLESRLHFHRPQKQHRTSRRRQLQVGCLVIIKFYLFV